jgi:hypothetical protein
MIAYLSADSYKPVLHCRTDFVSSCNGGKSETFFHKTLHLAA